MRRTLVAAAAVLGALGCSSCISRGTFVRTPRGPRKIEELVIGDALFSLDPLTGKTAETVLVAVRSATRECVQLEFPGATLIATSDHPLYDPDDGTWAAAGDWVLGKRTSLMRFDGERTEAMKVGAVSSYAGLHEVFDLSVKSELHNFIANDVLVHNKSPIEPTCQDPTGQTVQAFSECVCISGVGTGVVSCGGGPNDSYACVDCTVVDEDGGTQDAGSGEADAGASDGGQ